MKQKASGNLFQTSNALKILAYMIVRPGQEVLPGEIQKATALSRVGIYLALRQLVKQNLLVKQQRGRFVTYTVAHSNPVVRQFKVLNSILLLEPTLERLRPHAIKVVLYGSTSRGEDYPDSDIDLFVLSQDQSRVEKEVNQVKIKRKLQVIVKTPSEYVEFKDKNRTFQQEVDRGIILWEEKE